MKKGIAASIGIGIGRVVRLLQPDLSYQPVSSSSPKKELRRLEAAIDAYCQRTEQKARRVEQEVGLPEAEILSGHVMMIRDPSLTSSMQKLILEEGFCAEAALEKSCDWFVDLLSSAKDELTVQRAVDIRDVKNGVLSALLGVQETDISDLSPDSVLVTHELTPSMTVGIRRKGVAGIITETGGKTSHAAILARALGIPAVLGVEGALKLAADGAPVLLDGGEGTVIFYPTEEETALYEERREMMLRELISLSKFVGKETVTADGRHMSLLCNIVQDTDAPMVPDADGEGVGLLRTEYLFLRASALPGEQEQLYAYQNVMEQMKGRPVTIRTLDISGDKMLSAIGLPKERNPVLGCRSLRLCLKWDDMFRVQLRAMLRASVLGDMRILLPLVTCVEEIRQTRQILQEEMHRLDVLGIPYRKDIPLGVMLETPAAAMTVDILSHEADFFSIGTNDLTQYLMAVDRDNAQVASLDSHYQPALLRLLQHMAACAKQRGVPIGISGEAAADPLLLPLLISFGLDELSVSPSSVLLLRKSISAWTVPEANEVAGKALQMETKEEVYDLLNSVQR